MLLQILRNRRKLLQRRFEVSGNVGVDDLGCWKIRLLFESVILQPENVEAHLVTPRQFFIFAGGWQLSGIVRILAGPYLTVASGLDNALSGMTITTLTADQRPNQILPSPYAPNKAASQWLNPAAFAQPAAGTYGTMGRANLKGPGTIGINAALTRKFQVRENQSLEFRAEAFNLPNHVNLGNPDVTLTDQVFGRILSAGDPRTMQMALRYVF